MCITFHGCTSHTKYVSKEHGESFHFNPLPSLFHNSKQFSSSPFSYWKLFGSPAFQLVKVMGRPVDIQKNWPSSAKSVPDVQKCSLPKPVIKRKEQFVTFDFYEIYSDQIVFFNQNFGFSRLKSKITTLRGFLGFVKPY